MLDDLLVFERKYRIVSYLLHYLMIRCCKQLCDIQMVYRERIRRPCIVLSTIHHLQSGCRRGHLSHDLSRCTNSTHLAPSAHSTVTDFQQKRFTKSTYRTHRADDIGADSMEAIAPTAKKLWRRFAPTEILLCHFLKQYNESFLHVGVWFNLFAIKLANIVRAMCRLLHFSWSILLCLFFT